SWRVTIAQSIIYAEYFAIIVSGFGLERNGITSRKLYRNDEVGFNICIGSERSHLCIFVVAERFGLPVPPTCDIIVNQFRESRLVNVVSFKRYYARCLIAEVCSSLMRGHAVVWFSQHNVIKSTGKNLGCRAVFG